MLILTKTNVDERKAPLGQTFKHDECISSAYSLTVYSLGRWVTYTTNWVHENVNV